MSMKQLDLLQNEVGTLLFQKRGTLRHELTWSHYRRLLSVELESKI